MNDSWQTEHATAARLAQNVSELLQARNMESPSSAEYSRKNNEGRRVMTQFNNQLDKLKRSQMRNASSFHLSQREVDRRQGMLDEILTKQKQLEQLMNNPGASSTPGYGSSGGFGAQSSNPWADEDDMAANMSTHEIRQHQQNLVKDQDEGLDVLHSVIKRQKEMAIDIGNEIERQDEVIDDITYHTDVTGGRVREETDRIRSISLKEDKGNCALWITIIFLFIAIIVIVCLPKK